MPPRRPCDLLGIRTPRRQAWHEALRYATAAGLILATCAGSARLLDGAAPDEATREVDRAVMVELPDEAAAAHLPAAADSGPEQAAAAAAQAAPDQIKPRSEPPDSEPPTPPAEAAEIATVPPPPPAPTEAPVEAHPSDPPRDAPSPVPPATVAAAARDETAPAGSPTPEPQAADEGQGRPRPSSRLMTAWQRSLMGKLDAARRHLSAMRHASGAVTVAFRIDERGALVSHRVAKSSGSRDLDAAGLDLVSQAAPFPAPPAGSGGDELSFTVAIRFR